MPRSASRGMVAAAYRRLAKHHHPDTGARTGAMHDINWAWGVLSDDARRREWDAGHLAAGAHWTPRQASPAPATGADPGWAASGEPWSGGQTATIDRSAGLGCLPLAVVTLIVMVMILFFALSSGQPRLVDAENPAQATAGQTTSPP